VQAVGIRLEEDMWEALHEVCAREGISIHQFCTEVDKQRRESSLTAAIRVALLAYYRRLSQERDALLSGETPAGHSKDEGDREP